MTYRDTAYLKTDQRCNFILTAKTRNYTEIKKTKVKLIRYEHERSGVSESPIMLDVEILRM